MTILFDTHCHLCLDDFAADLEQVLQRAFDKGVKYILIPGLDIPTSCRAVEISEKYPDIYAAIGIHPTSPGTWNTADSKTIQELANHPKVIAIGEIGMDGYYQEVSWQEQELRFKEQIWIALTVGKPALIHNRDATQQILTSLNSISVTQEKSSKMKCIFHAYDGQQEILEYAEQHKCMISLGGNLTFPKSESLRQLANRIFPRAVLETDSPVMSPHLFRGKRNEPANLGLIAQKLAEVTGLTLEQVAEQTTINAKSYLGIK